MPAGPINTVADVFADPQFQARGMRIESDGIPGVRLPIRLAGTDEVPARRAPRLGEHTAEVLANLAPGSGRS